MPSSKNYKRDYKQEAKYHATEKQKKRRASRNAARRKMKAEGVPVGGKDVHHKDGNPQNNSRRNLTAKSAKSNRSFARSGKKYFAGPPTQKGSQNTMRKT